ncbi:hypothetical protein M0805_009241 [Coniferiporia weirii]|nr:hypothetical protein M0805_009241 [Coniferiporia weirii]
MPGDELTFLLSFAKTPSKNSNAVTVNEGYSCRILEGACRRPRESGSLPLAPVAAPEPSSYHHYVQQQQPPGVVLTGLWLQTRKQLAHTVSIASSTPGIMSLTSFVLNLLRHGPNIMLYPGAFEPHPRRVHLPSAWGLPYEDLTLTTSDRVKIRAYLLLQPERDQPGRKSSLDYSEEDQRPTVLMFHGNCDSIGYTLPLAQAFYKRMRCNVLMLSPRGYGLSEGKPSTKGLQRDSDAALNYILSHPKLSRSPIILYGQSMGGAMAIDLAGRRPDKITALIVENTFTSLRRLIPDIMPCFSFVAPFFQQWNSARTVEELPRLVSLLMLSGQRDEVIPPAHMRQLWEAAMRPAAPSFPGCRKPKAKRRQKLEHDGLEGELTREGRFVELPNGSHNDTWDDPAYWDAIEAFIEGLPVDSYSK